MRIAVISDSHNHLPECLPERLAGAAEIWHLGDVCDPETLDMLESIGVPLWVVRGNCDWNMEWPETLTLARHGHHFHLVHVPPRRWPAGMTAVLHGHTHVPRDETNPLGQRWLNPGSVTQGRHGAPRAFAWLNFASDGAWSWEPVRL
jgi:putative phosphoesterase